MDLGGKVEMILRHLEREEGCHSEAASLHITPPSHTIISTCQHIILNQPNRDLTKMQQLVLSDQRREWEGEFCDWRVGLIKEKEENEKQGEEESIKGETERKDEKRECC